MTEQTGRSSGEYRADKDETQRNERKTKRIIIDPALETYAEIQLSDGTARGPEGACFDWFPYGFYVRVRSKHGGNRIRRRSRGRARRRESFTVAANDPYTCAWWTRPSGRFARATNITAIIITIKKHVSKCPSVHMVRAEIRRLVSDFATSL